MARRISWTFNTYCTRSVSTISCYQHAKRVITISDIRYNKSIGSHNYIPIGYRYFYLNTMHDIAVISPAFDNYMQLWLCINLNTATAILH